MLKELVTILINQKQQLDPGGSLELDSYKVHKQKEIFELFSTVAEIDRNGNKGNGIGLSTVKKLINKMGGDIKVTSTLGEKTSFSFSIKKNTVKKTA